MTQNNRPLVIGNWKMNGDKHAWQTLAASLAQQADDATRQADVVVCPPLAALGVVREALATNARPEDDGVGQIKLGAQNLYPGEDGAVTGEVNAGMLKSMGCAYVILGHSERRALFSETDALVAQKTRAALAGGLVPVLCVGERESESESEGSGAQDPNAFLEKQLKQSLDGVTLRQLQGEMGRNLVIAYEPVWAIGTGKTATPEVIDKTTTHIRQILVNLYGIEVGERMRILYGGSMKAENAAEIMAVPHVSGGLIGGESLKARAFTSLVKITAQN